METLERDWELVQSILAEYSAIPYANGDYEGELVLDRDNDRYLLLTLGWPPPRLLYRHPHRLARR